MRRGLRRTLNVVDPTTESSPAPTTILNVDHKIVIKGRDSLATLSWRSWPQPASQSLPSYRPPAGGRPALILFTLPTRRGLKSKPPPLLPILPRLTLKPYLILMQTLPAPRTYSEVKANKKMRWWYEHLADFMIAHPEHTQTSIAKHFNRHTSTISTIINSDSFQAYLRARRAKYVETLDSSVRNKMMQVADKGFDLILDRFDKKRDSIPLETLTKTLEVVTKAAGMAPSGGGTTVNVNAPHSSTVVPVAVSLADLQQAQIALRNAQQNPYVEPPPPAIEGDFEEVEAQAEGADIEDLA